MELTKQEAIKNHREMWNWIAEQYINGSYEHVDVLKEKYLYVVKIEQYIFCDCYCCDYAFSLNKGHRCYNCPLVWTEEDVKNEDIKGMPYYCNKPFYCMDTENSNGLYGQIAKLTSEHDDVHFEFNRTKIISLAKQIAELEERK